MCLQCQQWLKYRLSVRWSSHATNRYSPPERIWQANPQVLGLTPEFLGRKKQKLLKPSIAIIAGHGVMFLCQKGHANHLSKLQRVLDSSTGVGDCSETLRKHFQRRGSGQELDPHSLMPNDAKKCLARPCVGKPFMSIGQCQVLHRPPTHVPTIEEKTTWKIRWLQNTVRLSDT